MSQPQTFEMQSSDGTTWTVTFVLKPDVSRWPYDDVTGLAFMVRVTFEGPHRRVANLGIDIEQASMWKEAGVLPADEAAQNELYYDSAVHHCRLHIDEIIGQEKYEYLLQDLAPSVDSGSVL